jgi:hypothetical protein
MDEIERYQQMNLLPTPRIGWETKQAYIGKLIEAHANEFLTDQEYEARMTWISNAQTEEQVKLAFKDLPPLRVTGVELTPGTLHTPPKHTKRKWDVTKTEVFFFLTDLGLATLFGVTGNMVMFWWFLILAAALAIPTIILSHLKGR